MKVGVGLGGLDVGVGGFGRRTGGGNGVDLGGRGFGADGFGWIGVFGCGGRPLGFLGEGLQPVALQLTRLLTTGKQVSPVFCFGLSCKQLSVSSTTRLKDGLHSIVCLWK